MNSYEAERQALESRLDAIFSTRDVHNFVNLSEIHALVARHDKRPTARLLGSAKLVQTVERLRGNGVDPSVCETGQKVFVHPELALEVVKTRRSDLKEFARRWETEQVDDLSLVVGRTPEILSRIKDVFGDTSRIRHVKLEGKFYFAAFDLAKIALWEGENTPSVNAISVYIQRAAEKDEDLKNAISKHHQFGYVCNIIYTQQIVEYCHVR